ncbi:hypothetical protein BXZ70DRAFT_908667 [Cristinia sonorae]|uniref:Uncharacterized protein n=1 Tax=Cristinia sonorae TaxID=1940300 RepID=A0A8K0ULY1_9AGAR|nr:hypothetical protein BXZ70DRAFT_908667 [Cristinia sonorae]
MIVHITGPRLMIAGPSSHVVKQDTADPGNTVQSPPGPVQSRLLSPHHHPSVALSKSDLHFRFRNSTVAAVAMFFLMVAGGRMSFGLPNGYYQHHDRSTFVAYAHTT